LPVGHEAVGIDSRAGSSGVPRAKDVVGKMHAVGTRGGVLENDLDAVADLRAKDRSEQPKVFVLRRARFPCCERRVGVLPVDRFAIKASDVIWSRLGVRLYRKAVYR